MESTRQLKYNRMLQKDLSEILQQNKNQLFNGEFVSVTEVAVSPDLRQAKIYVSFLNMNKKQELMELVEVHSKTIKHKLVARIGKQVRVMPELLFFYDDTAEVEKEVGQLFDDLEIPPEDKDYNEQDNYKE
jgi:ribosome-binding factor A